MRIASLLALLLVISAPALADQPALAAAAQAAAGGDYRAAVRNYEQILDREGFSAPLLFNLGNAWLRLGNPARAILNYERALVLSPHNAAIDEANLCRGAAACRACAPGGGPLAGGGALFQLRHLCVGWFWAPYGRCVPAPWSSCA